MNPDRVILVSLWVLVKGYAGFMKVCYNGRCDTEQNLKLWMYFTR